MPRFKNILLVAALLVTAGTLAAAQKRKAAPAHVPKPNPALLRDRQKVLTTRPLLMGYCLEDARGLRSIEEFGDQMTVLAPQSFSVEADGVVRGAVSAPLAELAARKKLPVMPLVVNSGFDRKIAATILRSPKLQERTASYLAYLAARENFVGWQIDFERVDVADKARYSAFIRRVAAKLHRDGRILSVAVTPRFSDNFPDNRPVGFRTGEWGAPFDYHALAKSADFLVLMTYDQHTSATPPGPVAGYDWVRAALDYAAPRVPHQKLVLGLPLYGREWVQTPMGLISRSMNSETLGPLLSLPEIQAQWHERWRAPWIEFQQDPDTHTVWFDDLRSYQEKLALVMEYGLRGVAAWRLGFERPDFWQAAAWLRSGHDLSGKEPEEPNPSNSRASDASK